MPAARPKLTTRKGARVPDHNHDSGLFAECLQAEVTHGTLLPCELFAPHADHAPDMGAACLPEETGAASRSPMRQPGKNG